MEVFLFFTAHQKEFLGTNTSHKIIPDTNDLKNPKK